jgi:hypothetical protein
VWGESIYTLEKYTFWRKKLIFLFQTKRPNEIQKGSDLISNFDELCGKTVPLKLSDLAPSQLPNRPEFPSYKHDSQRV